MIEKISVQGRDAWVAIDPYYMQPQDADDPPLEYFTATYYFLEPSVSPGGMLIVEDDQSPRLFESPVEALEYTAEKLGAMGLELSS